MSFSLGISCRVMVMIFQFIPSNRNHFAAAYPTLYENKIYEFRLRSIKSKLNGKKMVITQEGTKIPK